MKKTISILAPLVSVVCTAQNFDTSGIQCVCPSPDSSTVAWTCDGDLYVHECGASDTLRLTHDGTDVILNGFASWVYYEEIFGRPADYRSFWWSPDSRKLAFYRYDNTLVPMFPIYSPFGQDGRLSLTRYPKAGEPNPSVRIGFIDLDNLAQGIVWADFEDSAEQYFGVPFWSDDSRSLYISHEPRRQNTLDLYRVEACDGSKSLVYHEEYPTWVNWIEGMLFDKDGLYMVRDFETGWQQIYHLSYDGTLRRLTDGCNWNVRLLRHKGGDLWFTAKRDSRTHISLYRLNVKSGKITALTDPQYWARRISFSADGKTFEASLSNGLTPPFQFSGSAYRDYTKGKALTPVQPASGEDSPVTEIIKIQNDGYDLYGGISYPRGFDPSKKYPVIIELYGGPGTAYVRDWWGGRDMSDRWCWENGIVWMCVDPRSSGENGRAGMDQAFGHMALVEQQDYLAWAHWLQSQPWVEGSRIGADGFSFGGTTTAMLVLAHPDEFHCGIAGGGVYDWTFYDSHYTERFMDTPEANPEGYEAASLLRWFKNPDFAASLDGRKVLLQLTHGTGDDNVHFQNTLRLVDALQQAGAQFEIMIYPDGMHGYRGAQRDHDKVRAHEFWTRTLLDKQ